MKWILAVFLCLSLVQAQRLAPLPPGQDGWLFHQDEFGFYQTNNPASTQKALEHIVVINKLLESRGIKLIISLTPAKIGLYEDKLPEGYALSSSLKDRYSRALAYLRSEGVMVADIKTAFANSGDLNAEYPLFQRLDHHWSSKGALLAAQVVAETLSTNASELLNEIETVDYALSETGEGTYSGSSLYQLASPELKASLEAEAYYPEAFKQYGFERLSEASGGLFGDNHPEITLVGASFSQGEPGSAWPFYSALQYSLSKEIVNVAQTGKGPWEPMSDYLFDITFSEHPPKLIIWEIWELFLEAFGQANLNPDWLLNSSSQLAGTCDSPVTNLSELRSNGLLRLANGIELIANTPDTYLEFPLNNEAGMAQYLSFTLQFDAAERNEFRLELMADTWQRERNLPIQEGYVQKLTLPLYTEGGKPAKHFRLYPGASSSLSLSNLQVCTLPDYVVAALSHPLDLNEANLAMVEVPQSLLIDGLRGVEARYGRWGLGPKSEASFFLDSDRNLELALAFNTQLDSQGLELRFNGERLKTYSELKKGDFIQESLPIAAKAGMNRLELIYENWQGAEGSNSEDSTPYALFWQTLGFFEPGQVVYTPKLEQPGGKTETPTASIENLTENVPSNTVIAFPAQDIAKLPESKNITTEGFSNVEDGLRRWALGPGSSLQINTPEATTLQLDMSFFNPIEGQTVNVQFNDQLIESISNIAAQTTVKRQYSLRSQAGDNRLTLSYADWNLNNSIISEQDTRPMAILFDQLKLQDMASLASTPVTSTSSTSAEDPSTETSGTTLEVIDSLTDVIEVLSQDAADKLVISGLAEADSNQFRWSLGPETQLDFKTKGAEPIEVDMAFFNPIDGQNIIIRFNGALIQELKQIDQGTEMSLRFFVNSSPGLNHLSISYSHINGEQVTFAPNDQRPLGILYKNLDLLGRQ